MLPVSTLRTAAPDVQKNGQRGIVTEKNEGTNNIGELLAVRCRLATIAFPSHTLLVLKVDTNLRREERISQ